MDIKVDVIQCRQADGGLGPSTIEMAASAGANCIVAGSSVFGSPELAQVILHMRNAVDGAKHESSLSLSSLGKLSSISSCKIRAMFCRKGFLPSQKGALKTPVKTPKPMTQKQVHILIGGISLQNPRGDAQTETFHIDRVNLLKEKVKKDSLPYTYSRG